MGSNIVLVFQFCSHACLLAELTILELFLCVVPALCNFKFDLTHALCANSHQNELLMFDFSNINRKVSSFAYPSGFQAKISQRIILLGLDFLLCHLLHSRLILNFAAVFCFCWYHFVVNFVQVGLSLLYEKWNKLVNKYNCRHYILHAVQFEIP